MLGLAADAEPGTIIVFVFLLGTKRPRADAIAFLVGWLISLAVVFSLSSFVVNGHLPRHGGGEVAMYAAEIVLAPLLAYFAVREWRRRRVPRSADDPPKGLTRIESVGPPVALLAGLYEQPWTMTAAAALVVVRTQADAFTTAIAFVVFAVMSTIVVLAIFVVFLRNPDRAKARLDALERRLLGASPAVFAVIAGVASVCFLVDGVWGLAHH
jgi:threonine/homoserine/homoserine lactone efflux protein